MLPHHLKRVLVFVATFIFGAVVVFLVVLVGSSLGLFKPRFFVSFCSYCLWRVAHPFFGPCPSGLNPRGKFLWGLSYLLFLSCRVLLCRGRLLFMLGGSLKSSLALTLFTCSRSVLVHGNCWEFSSCRTSKPSLPLIQ